MIDNTEYFSAKILQQTMKGIREETIVFTLHFIKCKKGQSDD